MNGHLALKNFCVKVPVDVITKEMETGVHIVTRSKCPVPMVQLVWLSLIQKFVMLGNVSPSEEEE